MKIERWLDHEIRFILVGDEWWAMAKDVAEALGYSRSRDMVRMLRDDQKGAHLMRTPGGEQKVTIISETGIYKTIMRSKRKEAEEFEIWVFQVIKTLRQKVGLEGFAVFRMMDKEHQKTAMEQLSQIKKPTPQHYMKANSLTNKIVSDIYGFPKMIKKDDMTPEMLKDRQPILDDTVDLMRVKDNLNLDISVKKSVRNKWINN